MTGLSALLAIDTGTLDAKIALTADAKGASLSLSSIDPLDLLGDAGALIRTIGDIAGAAGSAPDAIGGGLDVLAEIAPFADIPELGEVLATLQAVRERLQPLRDLMALDPAAMVNRIMADGGGFDGVVQGIAGGVADAITDAVPNAIAAPIAAIKTLAGGVPQSADEIASFFARFMLGIDLPALRAPYDILDNLRAQIERTGDLDGLEARIVALTAKVDATGAALLGGTPDLDTIGAGLAQVRGEIELLTGSLLPDAIVQLTGDIAAIEPAALARRIDEALAPLIARVPVPPVGVGGFLLPPMRAIADGIDNVTADALTALLAEVEAEVRALFADSDVTRLRDDAAALLAGVVAFLDGLPLPSLRQRLTQALLGVEERIASLADYSPVADIGARLMAVTDAIESLDLTAVKEKIDALKQQIADIVDSFPIADIADALSGLLGSAADAVADLPPLVDELKAAIDRLAAEITGIDLSGAGDQAAGVVRDLRDNVKTALGNADLPDAVKAPLGILAGEVRKVDLAASVDKPLDELVAKVDLGQVLAPVQQALDAARAALLTLSPTALAQRLDEPYDAMLASLEQVSPAALIARLSDAFREATDEIERLDPVVLIAPLQHRFDALVDGLRQAADPAPLLAPLRAAYAELQALLDAIDPTQFLARVMGPISRLPTTLADTTGTIVGQKLGAGTGLPVAAPGAPFRFGDIVRPFAVLIGEARAVLKHAAESLIGEALELIGRPLDLLGHAGRVAGGHLAAIGTALERQRGIVDAAAPAGPLADLRDALEQLARIEASLAAGNRSSVSLGASVASIQLDVHVTTSAPDRRRLDDAITGVTDGLSTGALGRGFHALGNTLPSLAPEALALPDTQAAVLARLDAIFDAIDPTPVADEMDAVGLALQAKLESFAADLAKGLFRIWNAVFEELRPALPQGILPVLEQAMTAIRAQLAVFDPAQLEAELDGLLDATVATLEAYSPAAFAGTLTGSFDAVKARIGELDPATLLGDLSPLSDAIDAAAALRPSVMLAPLTTQAEAIDAALLRLLDFDPQVIVTAAIANLRTQIERVLQQLEGEIDGLLGDLESAGGGDSVGTSIG